MEIGGTEIGSRVPYIFLLWMIQERCFFTGLIKTLKVRLWKLLTRGDRDVAKLIIDEAAMTPSPAANGIVEYCWDDPTIETADNETNANCNDGPGLLLEDQLRCRSI